MLDVSCFHKALDRGTAKSLYVVSFRDFEEKLLIRSKVRARNLIENAFPLLPS
jgi:hypothetical protein